MFRFCERWKQPKENRDREPDRKASEIFETRAGTGPFEVINRRSFFIAADLSHGLVIGQVIPLVIG